MGPPPRLDEIVRVLTKRVGELGHTEIDADVRAELHLAGQSLAWGIEQTALFEGLWRTEKGIATLRQNAGECPRRGRAPAPVA